MNNDLHPHEVCFVIGGSEKKVKNAACVLNELGYITMTEYLIPLYLRHEERLKAIEALMNAADCACIISRADVLTELCTCSRILNFCGIDTEKPRW